MKKLMDNFGINDKSLERQEQELELADFEKLRDNLKMNDNILEGITIILH